MSPLPYTPEEPNYPNDPAPQLTSSFTRKPKRTSIATTVSDSINEWFDALDDPNDGLEEFVMDVNASPDAEPEGPSRILTNDSRSSLNESESSSIDTREIIESETPGRTQLPVPAPSDEGSLFAILKKNVGKVRRYDHLCYQQLTNIILRTSLLSHFLSPLMSPSRCFREQLRNSSITVF